jgi:hypothetical protein
MTIAALSWRAASIYITVIAGVPSYRGPAKALRRRGHGSG